MYFRSLYIRLSLSFNPTDFFFFSNGISFFSSFEITVATKV